MGKRKYTLEEYGRAMQMLSSGMSLTEISKKLGIPKSTLYYWKIRRHKPPLARWIPTPSRELSYVIGALLGDGTLDLHHYNYSARLRVKDYDFCKNFSVIMARLLNKRYRMPKWNEKKQYWHVFYDSTAFYEWAVKLKSEVEKQNLEILKQYIEHSKETVKYFLRGLFDAEGSNSQCKLVSLSNSNKALLEYVKYLLKRYFSITAGGPHLNTKAGKVNNKRRDGKIVVARRNCYTLSIYRRLDIVRFLTEIGFSIMRKQLGLRVRLKR